MDCWDSYRSHILNEWVNLVWAEWTGLTGLAELIVALRLDV